MIFKAGKFKIIHFDGLENLSDNDIFNGTTELDINIFVPSKGLLPITISWRFRIYDAGAHIFSYISTQNYLLEFEFSENPLTDTITMLSNSFNEFENNWRDKSTGSKVQEGRLPKSKKDFLIKKASEIIDIARQARMVD